MAVEAKVAQELNGTRLKVTRHVLGIRVPSEGGYVGFDHIGGGEVRFTTGSDHPGRGYWYRVSQSPIGGRGTIVVEKQLRDYFDPEPREIAVFQFTQKGQKGKVRIGPVTTLKLQVVKEEPRSRARRTR